MNIKNKIIYIAVLTLYILLLLSNIYGLILLANSIGSSNLINYIDPIFEIIIFVILVYVLLKLRYWEIMSFIAGVIIFFYSPETGIKSFKMSWYALSTGNFQAATFNFCIYMIPIVSAIGLIIWYLDKHKNNKAGI